ncbi:hypothetical protein [Sphingobium sp.]|uniref:hypothetical protein n=1 Tax=Sphingobium sp. TaxID=1912891 RepID=UPI000C5FB15D|nr:hypothetical protein [Sphingobium sp.]MBS90845.1 hypothetical protein [Sphingobium sp.]
MATNPKPRTKRTVEKGNEEHIAIVRGPLIAQIEALQDTNEKLGQLVTAHELRENELERRAERAEAALKQADRDAKAYAEMAIGEANDLRSRLMTSEMNYAKLRGYLEGKRDSEPPRMVPEQREPFHAQLPDASGAGFGSAYGNYAPSPKQWFHR